MVGLAHSQLIDLQAMNATASGDVARIMTRAKMMPTALPNEERLAPLDSGMRKHARSRYISLTDR